MAVTFAETTTTGRQLWSNDEQATPSVWGWYEQHMITWMGEICDAQLGAITAGSGYQDGTYQNVELRRKTWLTDTGGKHMLATVTITGGGVSTVQITRKGNGFKTGDKLVIYNLAEVGGTGSGYEQEVESASAEIGFVHDTQTATYPTYMVGQKVGFNRDSSFNYGTMRYKSSNTSTDYYFPAYAFTESTSNNGYGSWSVQNSWSTSSWYESNGDGYKLQVQYCNEPDNSFFFWTDDKYNPIMGWFRVTRPGDGPWPGDDVASQWFWVYGTDFSGMPIIPNYYTTAYLGAAVTSTPYPSDVGVLWGGFTRYGRSWVHGLQPTRLKAHANVSQGWGHEYQDADSGKIFKMFGGQSRFYIEQN